MHEKYIFLDKPMITIHKLTLQPTISLTIRQSFSNISSACKLQYLYLKSVSQILYSRNNKFSAFSPSISAYCRYFETVYAYSYMFLYFLIDFSHTNYLNCVECGAISTRTLAQPVYLGTWRCSRPCR